ncbi:hypothetical protein C5167_050652 [Papaver somniferum]|uniref:DUF1279 domain-containing protein n=1 Tax=Papaver somniferum TaxID=3469 RepID=A0A4Y7KSS2_PAPSO|nr:uncharacterized protein LOC113303496 [Papaver somniferum]RZC75161.1 hypothetical protein C5167_050652 [Papaver somniferum]
MAFVGRFRELMKKYGKVALGVHLGVSAASVTGLYFAINNNVDVENLLSKVGMSSGVTTNKEGEEGNQQPQLGKTASEGLITEEQQQSDFQQIQSLPPKETNKTAELIASSGGALALAVLCNKALFPIRVPITVGLTPPIARFLARRKLIKTQV